MSKTGMVLIGVLAAIAIVYQILERIPSDALNVALGVACGVGASIPVSFGLLIALTRRRHQNDSLTEWREVEPEPARFLPHSAPEQIAQPVQSQPQIIVLTPQQFAQGQFPQGFPMPAQWLNQQPYPFMQEHAETIDAREWRIIGED